MCDLLRGSCQLVMDLIRTCCGLVSDTTGKSQTSQRLATGNSRKVFWPFWHLFCSRSVKRNRTQYWKRQLSLLINHFSLCRACCYCKKKKNCQIQLWYYSGSLSTPNRYFCYSRDVVCFSFRNSVTLHKQCAICWLYWHLTMFLFFPCTIRSNQDLMCVWRHLN